EVNVVRVAIQALSAVLGGGQSLHTNGFDEALALPSEHAAPLALRTQQGIANEAGRGSTAHPPRGPQPGAPLAPALEERALELIGEVDERGGAVAAIEAGWIQGEIEAAAYEWTASVENGSRTIVGVNAFADDGEQRIELHRLDPAAERRQIERTE